MICIVSLLDENGERWPPETGASVLASRILQQGEPFHHIGAGRAGRGVLRRGTRRCRLRGRGRIKHGMVFFDLLRDIDRDKPRDL